MYAEKSQQIWLTHRWAPDGLKLGAHRVEHRLHGHRDPPSVFCVKPPAGPTTPSQRAVRSVRKLAAPKFSATPGGWPGPRRRADLQPPGGHAGRAIPSRVSPAASAHGSRFSRLLIVPQWETVATNGSSRAASQRRNSSSRVGDSTWPTQPSPCRHGGVVSRELRTRPRSVAAT
jgi:hypothetical protein